MLLRHAEAEDAADDLARALTEKGRRQAGDVGAFLDRHLPATARVLASPAVRAQQTARALGRRVETRPELAPGAPARAVLAVAGWPAGEGTVVLVGHEPTLGAAAALALGSDRSLSLKKGAFVWVEADPTGRFVSLRAALTPRLLRED